MAVKIKKDVKTTVSTDPDIKTKYTLAVPCVGLVIAATMGTYVTSPLISGNRNALYVFVALAGLGCLFAAATYIWTMTADSKGVKVHTLLSGDRVILYDKIKKVEVSRWKGGFVSYKIIRMNDKVFVNAKPMMTHNGEMLERFKKLGVKIVEV